MGYYKSMWRTPFGAYQELMEECEEKEREMRVEALTPIIQILLDQQEFKNECESKMIEIKEKELELRERELRLKEKELHEKKVKKGIVFL